MSYKPALTYLFTTYPVLTETFLHRELLALREAGRCPEIYSLWKGEKDYAGFRVQCFGWRGWVKGVFGAIYWSFRSPAVVRDWIQPLLANAPRNLTNFSENLIGALFACAVARRWSREAPRHVHAVWSSMPAAAAQLLNGLCGIPYSMGAHAYDLFEDGGDALLEEKAQRATFVVTSSHLGQMELIAKGVTPAKILLLRRGLYPLAPTTLPMPRERRPLRILSVGRLVEKMGHDLLLDLLAELQRNGFAFEATIVGGGPLHHHLQKRIHQLRLSQKVQLTGPLPYAQVEKWYRWGHVFVFSGIVAKSGDRAGFPNAIGEAMAHGLPVLSTMVGAVPEVIINGQNGFDLGKINIMRTMMRLSTEDTFYSDIRESARQWVTDNFDANRNTARLIKRFDAEAVYTSR